MLHSSSVGITICCKHLTLLEVINEYLTVEQQKQSYALALNSEFIGKADYQQTDVIQGDSIDMLFPIQGG